MTTNYAPGTEIWLGARFADGSVLVREVQRDSGLESAYRAMEAEVRRLAGKAGVPVFFTEAHGRRPGGVRHRRALDPTSHARSATEKRC